MSAGVALGSTCPSSAQPSFLQIPYWQHRTQIDFAASAAGTAAIRSITRLCRYYQSEVDPATITAGNLSPLEWPAVFADQRINPRRQRLEVQALLAANGLQYREIVPEQPRDLADTVAAAITDLYPVALNAPQVPIIFGYDRRERDPWWWTQIGEQIEIVTESERIARFAYWVDDPAATVAWVLTGVERSGSAIAADEYQSLDFLRRIGASVRGSSDSGVVPYPLSLRDLQNRLTQADSLPELVEPHDESDPVGVRRAIAAREHLMSILERAAMQSTDTGVSVPLRLALHSMHSSVEFLRRLDEIVHAANAGESHIEALRRFWSNPKHRQEAASTLTDVLKWEKQACAEIDRALAGTDRPPLTKKRR